VLSAGDTLVIHEGTYAENNLQPPGGSSGSPVTVMGAPGETVTIQPTSNLNPGFELSQEKAFITLKNLKLDGNEFISYGIRIYAADVILDSIEIAYPRNQGVALYRSPEGTSQRATLRNLNVHHAGQGASGCNGTVSKPGYCHGVYMTSSDNVIDGGSYANNNGYGIQNYPAGDNTIIRNTKVFNNRGGMAMMYGSNRRVYNNVVFNNTVTVGIWIGDYNSLYYSNTVYGNTGDGGIQIDQGSAQVKNTISVNNSSNVQNNGGASVSSSITSGSVNFVNAGAGDFHLLASATNAIGQGTVLGSPYDTDLDGNPRSQGSAYDIGAYAFGSSAQLPPPLRLRVISTMP